MKRYMSEDRELPSVLGLVIALGWTIYAVMLTRSVRLFTDENGVWMKCGIFP